MLRFNRPSFKSGVMIVKVTVDSTAEPPVSTELGWSLSVPQKGTNVDFSREGFDTTVVETALLAKYPAFLTTPA